MQKSNSEPVPPTLSRESIKLPILAPLFAAIFVLLATSTITIYYLQEHHSYDDLHERIENTDDFFKDELAEDARILGAAIHLLKSDPKLQQLWLAKDREALYKYTAPIFENLRDEYKITHFYFIDVNYTSFLRVHKPESFGDRVERFAFRTAEKTQKPF